MKNNMYVVKNVLSGVSDGIYLFPTDKYCATRICDDMRRCKFDLNDYQILKVGTFDTESLDMSILENAEVIPFDDRHRIEVDGSVDNAKQLEKEINSIA